MNRIAMLAALAALGACSTPPQTGGPAVPQPNIVTFVHPYHSGSGVVQGVMQTPASAQPMQRLEIKMDTGTIVYVDTESREFTKGTRVVLTEDKVIRKL